jgi:succinoglycan biosynthesis transport protein ExoP
MTVFSSDMNTPESSPLRGYLAVLRRRKFVAIQSILIVPIIALLITHFQAKKYQSSAEVLLNRSDPAAMITGLTDPTAAQAPDRFAATQGELARVPTVARRALKAAGVNAGPEYLLNESSVTPHPDADLLDFEVTDRNPDLAQRLASQYAHHFTLYQSELEEQSLTSALGDITRRLHALQAAGQQNSPLYADLVGRRNQLTTLQALHTAPSAVVRDATGAVKVAPRPFRNAVLGLAVGIILGLGLAFLYDTLDPRVWTAPEAAESLGLRLLGRIPRLKKGSSSSLVMAADPHSPVAESFRMLSTNIDFVNEDKWAKTILVTSAVSGEGKSTTTANLAIALARKGHNVVLVDLDLRSPSIDDFFSLNGHPGLTDVALGNNELSDAIVRAGTSGSNGTDGAGLGVGRQRGSMGGVLEVVPAGQLPLEPGEFVTRPAVQSIISQLAARADFVLIDSPPLLVAGDTAVLSAYVDAVMLVVRLDRVRQPTLVELRRALEGFHCEKLGVVVTATDEVGRYGSYYSGQYNRRPAQRAWHASVRTRKRA